MRLFKWSKLHLSILVLILAGASGSAWGNEIMITPSASLKQEYNDNIFLNTHNKQSDFITTFSPGVELSDRSERLDAALSLRFNGILYGRYSNLSAIDQYYNGRLSYMLTPRTRVSGTAAYILDSQPDRDFETTGLVLGAVKRHRQTYSFSLERSLTEKTSLGLNYNYQQDVYDSSRFTNIRWHDVELSLIHDLDSLIRNTKGSLNLGYTRYDFTGSSVDNYSLTVGLDKALTETWGVQAFMGGRYTVSRFQIYQIELIPVFPPFLYEQTIVPVRQTSREWGWVGQLAVTYKGETTGGSLSFNSDVKPSSGLTSGTTIRTGVTTEVHKRFTYELSGAMMIGYYHNKSNQGAFAGQRVDEDSIMASPSIRYEFNKDMFMEASYRYSKVYYNVNTTNADRNIFFVKFYYQYPM